MENSYICAACGGVFVSTRSDQEAFAEAEVEWGDAFTPDDVAVVCDTCWQYMNNNIVAIGITDPRYATYLEHIKNE